MTFHPFRILYPSAPIVPASTVEQPAGSVPTSFADPANVLAGGVPVADGHAPPATPTEHARLTEDTADLWFALVARLES